MSRRPGVGGEVDNVGERDWGGNRYREGIALQVDLIYVANTRNFDKVTIHQIDLLQFQIRWHFQIHSPTTKEMRKEGQ